MATTAGAASATFTASGRLRARAPTARAPWLLSRRYTGILHLPIRNLTSRATTILCLPISNLLDRTGSISTVVAADNIDGDRLALRGNGLIIEVEEVTRAALEEVGGVLQGELVVADGKSAGGQRVDLTRSGVELELVVGHDGSNAALGVGESTVFQGGHKASRGTALREV